MPEFFYPLIAVFLAGLIVFLILYAIYTKYKNFAFCHSVAIRALQQVNGRYAFYSIESLNLENSYDNEDFYNTVAPIDYLTYQLVYMQKDVRNTIKKTYENREIYTAYLKAVGEIAKFEVYDAEKTPRNLKWLAKLERRLFDEMVVKPNLDFFISVRLRLTKINGDYRCSKKATFGIETIEGILALLKERRGNFYLDNDVWQAICRVERAKVTNKMRFAIYARDNHRCKKCGSTQNLEVDHIFPISKGGKTVFENLQTLCHNCNVRKSNIVEPNYSDPFGGAYEGNGCCNLCGAPLVLRHGKYGQFYGCSNFPKCRYIKK